MATTKQGSGFRRRTVPGEKVEIAEGPLRGVTGTVIERDRESVLLWLDRGIYARVQEVFLRRIERRW
jgi:hypothetical protein